MESSGERIEESKESERLRWGTIERSRDTAGWMCGRFGRVSGEGLMVIAGTIVDVSFFSSSMDSSNI